MRKIVVLLLFDRVLLRPAGQRLNQFRGLFGTGACGME